MHIRYTYSMLLYILPDLSTQVFPLVGRGITNRYIFHLPMLLKDILS